MTPIVKEINEHEAEAINEITSMKIEGKNEHTNEVQVSSTLYTW